MQSTLGAQSSEEVGGRRANSRACLMSASRLKPSGYSFSCMNWRTSSIWSGSSTIVCREAQRAQWRRVGAQSGGVGAKRRIEWCDKWGRSTERAQRVAGHRESQSGSGAQTKRGGGAHRKWHKSRTERRTEAGAWGRTEAKIGGVGSSPPRFARKCRSRSGRSSH